MGRFARGVLRYREGTVCRAEEHDGTEDSSAPSGIL
jgi:hypothetical protein